MLDHKYTRIFNTEHQALETAAVVEDEGIALTFAKEGVHTVVRPSTGAAGEIFAGVSITRNAPPMAAPYFGEGRVVQNDEGNLAIKLPRIPLASEILIRVDGEAKTITANAPADATEAQLDGDTITFHADAENKVYSVTMQYEPTVSEARMYAGDMPVGGLSHRAEGVIGMITKGQIATSYFDASADWNSALEINLGPNGKFTVGGGGVVVPNAQVITAPFAGSPYLVMRLG